MRMHIASALGIAIVVVLGALGYHWFGPVAVILVGGIGFPAVLALTYYLTDLETRKGARGWPSPKDLGL